MLAILHIKGKKYLKLKASKEYQELCQEGIQLSNNVFLKYPNHINNQINAN